MVMHSGDETRKHTCFAFGT